MNNPIEYLIHWANTSPKKIAIQNTASQFSYEELLDRVCKISSKLKSLGIKPQQTVVISIIENHFRWIFSLALFHLGASQTIFKTFNTSDDVEYDWVISDGASQKIDIQKLIVIDRAWLLSIKDLEFDLNFYNYKKNDLILLFSTSGTSGTAKKVAWNLSHLEYRAKSEVFNTGEGNKITLFDNVTNIGFYIGFYAFMFGETLFTQESNNEIIELIERFKIKTLHGSPSQISSLIETIINERHNNLSGKLEKVIAAGSVISQLLLNNIHKYLSANIYSDYGSTETGIICKNFINTPNDLNTIGAPLPDVKVQIVDEVEKELPEGEIGQLRIKSPYMVTSYFNDKKASSTFFKNGWFYPGDRGFVNNRKEIVLSGRDKDIVNVGGIKANQFLIDAFLLKYRGVIDAACFTFQNNIGADQLAAAIVSEKPLKIDILKTKLIEELGASCWPQRIFRAEKIYRNTNGKVDRAKLALEILRLDSKTKKKFNS